MNDADFHKIRRNQDPVSRPQWHFAKRNDMLNLSFSQCVHSTSYLEGKYVLSEMNLVCVC